MDELEYLRREVERLCAAVEALEERETVALEMRDRAMQESVTAQREIERLRTIVDKYTKLLMLVTDVCPGETRHETAVRLLQQRQEFNSAQEAKEE